MTDTTGPGVGMKVRQVDDNVHTPSAYITDGEDGTDNADPHPRILDFAQAEGDISDQLTEEELTTLGIDCVDEWHIDDTSRADWMDMAKMALDDAAQEETTDDQSDGSGKDSPWTNASNVKMPYLSVSASRFNAKAYPAVVKNDQAVGVKVFGPKPKPIPPMPPQLQQAMQAVQAQGGQPPPELQQAMGQYQNAVQQAQQEAQTYQQRQDRAERIKNWLNYTIFYRMDDWEGDLDAMLSQIPIVGIGFKKVYSNREGLQSDYVSAMKLTVHQDTRSLKSCPRITQSFDAYPYEIEERRREGVYRDVELTGEGIKEDPQAPRALIEQHRMCDLDHDGLDEPYIVTVDVETKKVLRVEAAFGPKDFVVDSTADEKHPNGKIVSIKRWNPWVPFPFMPDPKGRFYAIGFGKLMRPLVAQIDTAINQLNDAGHAQIAGGGFISSGIRLQGVGQMGSQTFQPGEYKVVNAPGGMLKDGIWERTVPQPSAVTMQLVQEFGQKVEQIGMIQDVVTGDAPSTAPVGTTLALQDAALQPFSSLFKRFWRGLKQEFRLMYDCERRWASDETKALYAEITGGVFDEDFAGDGADIEPVADPSLVTRQQAVAKSQAGMALAESPIGQSAGMTQPGPAKEMMRETLGALGYEEPDRFFADVQPNPELVAKTQLLGAQAQKAKADTAKTAAEIPKVAAETSLTHAKTVHAVGESIGRSHDVLMAGEAALAPPEETEGEAA